MCGCICVCVCISVLYARENTLAKICVVCHWKIESLTLGYNLLDELRLGALVLIFCIRTIDVRFRSFLKAYVTNTLIVNDISNVVYRGASRRTIKWFETINSEWAEVVGD